MAVLVQDWLLDSIGGWKIRPLLLYMKDGIDEDDLNPLTTKAESYSDMPEIFITDSSNLKKKKKCFYINVFPPGVTKI